MPLDVRPPARAPREPLGPRAALAGAIVCILIVLAAGAYLRIVDNDPFGIDLWWRDAVQIGRGSVAYSVASLLANVGGGAGAILCTAAAVAALMRQRRPSEAATVAATMLFGVLSSELLKAAVMRPRPLDPLFAAHGYSYPSGHSMGAAALAVSLALVLIHGPAKPSKPSPPNAVRVSWAGAWTLLWPWLIAGCWITGMMWSRTALQVHWLSDTIAGALLGTGIAILTRRLCLWIRPESAPGTA